MLVKVFEAEEMSAALKMVKETLGPDALILSTRTLRKGGMGVFGKSVLEVTAAVESPALAAPPPATAPRGNAAQVGEGPETDLDYRDIWRQGTVVAPVRKDPLGEPPAAKETGGESLATVRAELDELKTMLRQVTQNARAPQVRQESGFAQAYALAGEGGALPQLLGELTRRGIDAAAAEDIVRGAKEQLTPRQLGDSRTLQEFLQEKIGGMVPITGPLFARSGQQQRIALIGPTGVGKTTTLAKLAADYLTHDGGTAALVTIDTYRIAAVEQLKVYGEILGLPVEVVFSPAELQGAFSRHADKDLILVDTAGRSPRDEHSLDELAAFLGPQSGTSNHLVLAAPTRNGALRQALAQFARLPLDSLIFTKLDECEDLGALVNIPVSGKLPVSYLTNGQRVPEDLLTASAAIIADYVMGHELRMLS